MLILMTVFMFPSFTLCYDSCLWKVENSADHLILHMLPGRKLKQ